LLADPPGGVKRKRIDRPIGRIHSARMDDTRDEREAGAGRGRGAVRPAPKDDREARLAAALRANLRRRKAGATKAPTRPGEDREG